MTLGSQNPRRVAFFGGTFDPVHLGHLEIAAKARRALQLDEIIFMPCKQSPHKESGPQASDDDRLQMLHLATQDFPWARVSDFELKNPPPSFTWKTLTSLKPELPHPHKLFLLIGLDQWESLPHWQHPEKIAQLVDFIVVGRDGTPQERANYRAHFLSGDHPASASAIRTALSQKETPSWLQPETLTYVREHGLYL